MSHAQIPQVVSFLNLQHEVGDAKGKQLPSGSLRGRDMHRLLRPAVPEEEGPVKPVQHSRMFIPFLGRADSASKDGSEPPKQEYELQLDEEVLARAHVALVREVRAGNDFRVQEILQVTPGVRRDLLQRRDADGNTVLHLAANMPSNEEGATVLSYLQYSSADLEAKNMLGETALVLAVRQALDKSGPEALKLISCLLKGRADPNTTDLLNKETPLMEAACCGCKAVAQLLLDFKADVAKATDTGSTALDFATSEGHSNLVKILVAAEARARDPKDLWEAPFATTMGFGTWSSGLESKHESQCGQAESTEPEQPKKSKPPMRAPTFAPNIFACGPQIRSRLFVESAGEFTEFTDASYMGYAAAGPKAPAPPKAPPRRGELRIWEHGLSEHFATLGLQAGATVDDVRAAYRKLALQYHPESWTFVW